MILIYSNQPDSSFHFSKAGLKKWKKWSDWQLTAPTPFCISFFYKWPLCTLFCFTCAWYSLLKIIFFCQGALFHERVVHRTWDLQRWKCPGPVWIWTGTSPWSSVQVHSNWTNPDRRWNGPLDLRGKLPAQDSSTFWYILPSYPISFAFRVFTLLVSASWYP